MHLQGVECADLQLGMVVQELLHDRFEGQQQLFLLLQLLFRGGGQLLVALHNAQLLGDVLEETGIGSEDSGRLVQCELFDIMQLVYRTIKDQFCFNYMK